MKALSLLLLALVLAAPASALRAGTDMQPVKPNNDYTYDPAPPPRVYYYPAPVYIAAPPPPYAYYPYYGPRYAYGPRYYGYGPGIYFGGPRFYFGGHFHRR